MYDPQKNSALCGHLLVSWAMILHVVGLASCPMRAVPVLGLLCGALALASAHAGSGYHALNGDGDDTAFRYYLASAAFTFAAWLLFVIGAFWS